MALQTWVSSTFNTTNTYIKSRTVVELNSRNISANTSNVRIYVQAWRTNNYDTYGSGTCYLNYTDTSLHQLSQAITSSQHITLNSYTILFDTTVDVQHNPDGTLTLQTSQNIDHNQFDSSGWGTFNVDLPTIPREAYVTSSSNLIIGNNLAYTLNNPANYYVKLQYYVYNGSGWTLIKTYNAGTGTSGTITMGTTENNAMYQCMPNSVEQNAFIRAYTYSDSGYSVQIGTYKDTTSSPYGKCSVNQEINKPDVSTSIVDGNSNTTTLTGNQNKFIKYYSDAQYSITGTPKNYTTIKSYKITCGTKSNTTASGTLSSIESPIFTVRVTDNRDLYTEVTYDRTTDFINYILPTFNPTVYRKSPLTGEAELTFNGNYFDGNFGAELNELTIIATYREVGGTWSGGQNLTATYDGNTFNQGLTPVSLEDLFGLTTPYFDYQKVYEFHFEVYDKLKTLSVPIQTLYKGEPVLWWNENSVNINGSLYIGTNKIEKATGAEIDTGTNDVKFVTSKAIADSKLIYETDIVDNLTFTSTTDALSANQGKVLNEKFSEVVLYNNATGTTGTVTLSETSANFSYLEIHYRNNDGYYDCKKIYNPNGKKCGLNLTYYNNVINQFQHWSGTASISGTTITHTLDYYTSNSTTATSINYIYIVRVVGYR